MSSPRPTDLRDPLLARIEGALPLPRLLKELREFQGDLRRGEEQLRQVLVIANGIAGFCETREVLELRQKIQAALDAVPPAVESLSGPRNPGDPA